MLGAPALSLAGSPPAPMLVVEPAAEPVRVDLADELRWEQRDYRTAGTVILAAGGVALIAGVVMTTRARQQPHESSRAASDSRFDLL